MPLDTLLVPARILLATVFLIGAVGKARAGARFSAQLERYSVPRSLRQPTAVAILVTEVSVAAALLWSSPIAQFGAVAAAAVLVVFTSAAGFRFLVRRDRGDCMCFGDLLRERLSWMTLARNSLLAATSVVITGREMENLFAAPLERLLPGALIAAACALTYAQIVRVLGLESTPDIASNISGAHSGVAKVKL